MRNVSKQGFECVAYIFGLRARNKLSVVNIAAL